MPIDPEVESRGGGCIRARELSPSPGIDDAAAETVAWATQHDGQAAATTTSGRVEGFAAWRLGEWSQRLAFVRWPFSRFRVHF